MSTKTLKLTVPFKAEPTQIVHVFGDLPELGEWDASKAIPLKSNDQEQWELELPVVIVPTLTQFRYKYMVLSPSDEKNVPQMEPAHDHVITLEQFSDHITITDVWGGGKCIIEIPVPANKKDSYPGKLYRSPLPFATKFDPFHRTYEDWQYHKIDVVVCLVPIDELQRRLKFDLLKMYGNDGIATLYFPITDLAAPPAEEVEALRRMVTKLDYFLKKGHNVVVHCHAGIGRTGLVLCCWAKKFIADGQTTDELIAWARSLIRGAVQTPDQIQFVEKF